MLQLSWSAASLIAVAILFTGCQSDGDANYEDRTCKDIIGNEAAATIFWIGLLRKRFVLITSTQAVYDLDPSSLDNQAHKLYLSGPKPMKEIYPELYKRVIATGDNFFRGGQKRLAVTDEENEYLYSESQFCKKGSLYDYKTSRPSEGEYSVTDQVTNGKCTNLLTMSSVEPLTFYAIYYANDKDPSGQILKANFKGAHDLRHSTTLQQFGDKYHICKVDKSTDKLSFSTHSCPSGVFILNAGQGFVDNYNIYVLSANQTVHIFAKTALTAGNPVTVYKVKFEDFFICGPNRTTLYILLAIVLAIILFICCCLCFICFFCRKRNRGPLLAPGISASASKGKSRSRSKQKKHKRRSRSKSKSRTKHRSKRSVKRGRH